MSLPIPHPLFSCKHCAEHYSWPAKDLSWSELRGQWVCLECWDGDYHGQRATTLLDEIEAGDKKRDAITANQLSSQIDSLLSSRINKAYCDGKDEVRAALIEIKQAIEGIL